jgi:Fur family ferric uptake transcriptional regulator
MCRVTVASSSSPLPFSTIEEVAEALRGAGTRLTTPRRMVLETLFAADTLLTAEQIADGSVTGVPLDLTSVYRTLERLEELGVVRHMHIGHGASVYGLLSAGEREFLVCERCWKVTVAGPEQLDRVRAVIREQFGYEARYTHFPLHGRCADCATG